eukprot:CAMPEP_0178388806 /NCGR_PEP_ID=MMETSP0689_2-20121128/9785_1 /TAXON_ID=160604 /ORGANISM="Amphidinium massartii, Strain CS-259" /LENGTH=547 /DNA_ID=CAMNT_0020009225 /DNA_START=19 /DNA_END=1659 /DNA_ORIENTATION=-
MPYLEDGETWNPRTDGYEEGMAENKPGHKPFGSYGLPGWVKHPLSHPASAVIIGGKEYMHAGGDGMRNRIGWSVGHIGAKFGDLDLLAMCTPEELNWQDIDGNTPAAYACLHGCAWALKWLVDNGADVTTPNFNGHTPEDQIWMCGRLHAIQQQWLSEALKGDLSEKNSVKAQEYRIQMQAPWGKDPLIGKKMEQDLAASRKFWFSTGDYQMPYKVPAAEDLPTDLVSSKLRRRAMLLPPEPVALLFPGAGTQRVGLLDGVLTKPYLEGMLETAQMILEWDVKAMLQQGPEEALARPRHSIPAVFFANALAMKEFELQNPELWKRPQAVAGLSTGELSAILAAGVLDFEDSLRLCKRMAEAVETALDAQQQTMASIVGLERARVEEFCAEAAAAEGAGAVCRIGQAVFPGVSGTLKAVEKLVALATGAKAMQARLVKGSAAMHCPVMQKAVEEFDLAIDELLPRMKAPRCAIYFNSTGKQVPTGTEPAAFIGCLRRLLESEVMWEALVKSMIMDGVKQFFEVGPGKQLKSMIKRIDQEAFKHTENIT